MERHRLSFHREASPDEEQASTDGVENTDQFSSNETDLSNASGDEVSIHGEGSSREVVLTRMKAVWMRKAAPTRMKTPYGMT